MDNLQAIAVIIGLVNGIRLFKLENKEGFYLFCAALAIGVVLGFVKYFGLTIETGIVVALASSGLYRVSEKVGSQ